ncbi:tubulin-like doman-containing protein [Corynebacterium doosanense]|uniref:Tubulin-like protein n=1 Tax=Corynebacterium doosanense CAU 212 = DSM 45436 TaxID=558173 RepID=A0A097IDR0_9CORY|nr:tubulin-like doman-containing protein [Corynebacterium doosanense]AIT60283.1 hypothetical protein CDOO_02715 [Corynebacterium doosanense CAU 212 = DSM 45436]
MSKFLVVGCGGSGSATQAYMLDQLRAHQKKVTGSESLPQEWQFVAIDVPVSPESGPDGLPNVRESNGAYVSTGQKQTYASFDRGLSQTLGSSNNKALGEIATWASRTPSAEQTPIDKGAGQYRGIGRILTIQNLGKIRSELENAVNRINDAHGDESAPLVFVISSMAGGAGASMFLDVCRLLTTINGISPANIAAFMFTPEVFESLSPDSRVGQWPNSLAMFGEAVAAQFGSDPDHDRRLYQAMGINEGVQDVSVGRLIPIGARMGANGAKFGEGTPKAIYRGIGKALSSLMTSKSALESFERFTMGNRGGKSPDRSVHGWGDPQNPADDNIPWGSMGYAQLSLGRDRYAEYAAQRLAKQAFDRLLEGHLDKAKPHQNAAEQMEVLITDNHGYFIGDIGLPMTMAENNDEHKYAAWFQDKFRAYFEDSVQQMRASLRGSLRPGDGEPLGQWRSEIENALADPRLSWTMNDIVGSGPITPEQQSSGRGISYRAAHRFADDFANSLIAELEKQLGKYGIPYVEALVEKLRLAFSDRFLPVLEYYHNEGLNSDPMWKPARVHELLQPLNGRGKVSGSQQIISVIEEAYVPQFSVYFRSALAGQLRAVLSDFDKDVLAPLLRELTAVHRDLTRAAETAPSKTKLSDVTTNEPTAWPREREDVPARFRGSDNEVVVSRIEDFKNHYEQQLVATQHSFERSVTDLEGAASSAVREIILGVWQTQGAEKAPRDTLARQMDENQLVGNRVGWVSSRLVVDPSGNAERRSVGQARFDIKVRPDDLLRRARSWVARPGLAFQQFIDVDLRSYITEGGPDYHDRLKRLADAFTIATANARPLAAVNPQVIGAAYNGDASVDYRLSFSEIPFLGLSDVLDELKSVLIRDNSLDKNTTLENFSSSSTLTDSDSLERIEVFGAYPNYSPIVFSSLLPEIADYWASLPGDKGTFWNLRRARPLASALPVTTEERQAYVAGWLIGTVIGRIFIENKGTPQARALIYSDRERQWIPFPKQLLTPPLEFKASYDWMPAVIESVLLAYANVHNTAGGIASSLRPYQALRGLWNDGQSGPTKGEINHSVVPLMANWLRDGWQPEAHGLPAAPDTPEERYELLKSNFQKHLTLARDFVPSDSRGYVPGSSGQEKPFADVTNREHASMMPLYRDIAPDVVKMVPELLNKLDEALEMSKRLADTGYGSGSLPGVPQFGAVDQSAPQSPPTINLSGFGGSNNGSGDLI